jgi:uncharacterized membrane protein YccC
MRPGYGLTKERSFHRLIGTVLGGILAFGILYLVNDKSIIGVFSIACMLLGFYASQLQNKCHICHHVCIHLWNHYTKY